jgi:hypothetical protein
MPYCTQNALVEIVNPRSTIFTLDIESEAQLQSLSLNGDGNNVTVGPGFLYRFTNSWCQHNVVKYVDASQIQ